MKILYAASNRKGASIQLSRFQKAILGQGINLKIAAYSTIDPTVSIDWNLESLHDIFYPDNYHFDNDKLANYYDQIKKFNPDLIISDLEIYTSYLATDLPARIWQVSPILLHHGTPHKEKIAVSLSRSYPFLFKDTSVSDLIRNILFNADRKLIYSHLGDAGAFAPVEGYEWVRPYHVTGKRSIPCQHNIVAASIRHNKKLLSFLKKNEDAILFSNSIQGNYSDVILKSILDLEEYACNLKNSELFMCQGHGDFLADAYYNGRHPTILPDFEEMECVINAMYSRTFNTATVCFSSEFEIMATEQEILIDNQINYLHEKIKEL